MYNFKEPKQAYESMRMFMSKGKTAGTIEFPPYITFELVNKCNFRCFMCPSTYMQRHKREMDFDFFRKTIDEISTYGSMIRFIGYSEPLLYSRINDAIKYVKDKGLLLHITTNGSLLDQKMAKILVDNKVDSIIFSFQGLSKKEYCYMRRVDKKIYHKIIENIKQLRELRKNKKPYIKITTTITDRDTAGDKTNFIKEHLKYTDEVQITGFTHFMHIAEEYNKKGVWSKLGITQPEKIKKICCFVPNFEMLIKSDENIYACCGDYTDSLKIGQFGAKSLYEIWHSKKAENLRKIINSGDLDKFKNCAVCPIRYKYKNINSTVINSRQGKVENFLKK